MIPFDIAVDMLRGLSEADYESAANYISSIATRRYSPDVPLTRGQILEDLTISRQQEKEGGYQPAKDALNEVMASHGLQR